MSVKLDEVSASDAINKGNQEQFSLLFLGPKDKFLEQASYELSHEKVGKTPMLLVPVGEEKDHFLYESVFCRLKND